MLENFSIQLRATIERRVLTSNAKEIGEWQRARRLNRYYAIADLSEQHCALLADPTLPSGQPLLFSSGEAALSFAEQCKQANTLLVMLSTDRKGELNSVYAHHLTQNDLTPVVALEKWFVLFSVTPNMRETLQVKPRQMLAEAS